MADISSSDKKNKDKDNRKGRMDRKKRHEELEKQRKRDNIIMGSIGLVFIIIIIAAIALSIEDNPNNTDYSNPYEIIGDELVIPRSDVSSTAKFFSYDTGGKNVKFFAVVGSDGDVHTALDACDVCFQEKKGYFQDGSYMVCRNCGNRYTTNQIGTANTGGGCWPSYLARTVDSANVKIKLSDLDNSRSYFP